MYNIFDDSKAEKKTTLIKKKLKSTLILIFVKNYMEFISIFWNIWNIGIDVYELG